MATTRCAAGDTFDYVIVGSGAAGSVLASRLTEDPGVTVCVLEAGPPDRHPYIHIPAGFIKMLFNPNYTWQFKTEPAEGIGGRRIPTTQGRTLGGSSSINGMIYNRGQRADFDNWAQRGNRGWGYVDMLPYFKRTERRIGIADDRIHGREGNLPVTDIDWIHPVCEAFIAGAVGTGDPALRRLQQRRQPGGRRLLPARDPSRLAAFRRAGVPASGEGDRPAGRPHRCARRRGPVRRQARDRRALCERPRPHDAARGACAARGDPVAAAPPTPRSCCRFPASGRPRCWSRLGVPVVHELPASARISATITPRGWWRG